MNTRLLLKTSALAALVFVAGTDMFAQGCTNDSQFPSATIAPGAVNVLTSISTCSFLQEYSAVGPVVAGTAYEFSINEGGYITVHEGTATGTVIAQGYSPLVAVATTAGTLYAHWNVDANCVTGTGCKNTNVMTLSCVPPTVSATVVEDCPNGQFSVSVDVTALGDAASVDIDYTVNGGPVQTLAAQPVGTYSIGPFTAGQLVNVTVADVSDSTCNRSFSGLGSTNCPVIIECGGAPLEQTYCYVNNDNTHWHYQSSNDALPLILIFSSGNIESANYDNLRIYNGPDNLSPLLWENPTGTTDLTGIQVVASSGHIYMEVTSEGSVSCATNADWTWNWQVGCLDCNPAEATYLINTDCDAQSFTIDVHVNVLGSDPTLEITNDAGAALVTATDTGTYTVGPFPITTEVTLTLVNEFNSLCNVVSPVMTNPLCPTHITCGEPALQQTYCYTNDDFHEWHWQNTDPGSTLAVQFTGGSIGFDDLTIYDGPDNTGAILFQANDAMDLDTLILSSGPDIFMEMSSAGFGSCETGEEAAWVWQVGCYDCAPPVATYTVITDCDAQNFTIDVHITDMGSQGSLEITNDTNAVNVTAQDTGHYTVGPFGITTEVVLTLENDTNSLCSVTSPMLTNPLCATIIQCGGAPLDQEYCYTPSDNHTWHWTSSGGEALIMIFSDGTIENNNWDDLRIYDGPDNLSPLLFENGTSTMDLDGLQFIGTSGHLYMEMSSDGSVSCSSSTDDWTWLWQVGCLDCTPSQATYTVNTDCDAQTFTIDVHVNVLGSDSTLDITNDAGAALVTATDTGTYTVGPFPITTEVTLTLENEANSLCNVTSPMLTNPLCPTHITCGEPALQQTYCYTNDDLHLWHWQNTDPTGTLALLFHAGSIAFPGDFGDNLIIYDGADENAPILFQNTTAMDLIDTLILSTGDHIYMTLTSSGFGSCDSGAETEWEWEVGCYDCTPPVVTYNVVTDCDSMQYMVEVEITELGSDPVVDIINDGGALPMAATAAGTYAIGPFAAGDTVVITLVNDVNSLCSINSGELTNPLCPTVIQCGGAPLDETYCYINNDNHQWHWQSSSGSPLAMQFSAGTLESSTWDELRIYDGPDNTSPLLFEHTQTNDFDLTGLLVIGSSGHIYMENSSDGVFSCADQDQTMWEWNIGCLDCTNPGATFSVVEDCIHHSFSVAVNVDSTGSSPVVRIANTLNGDTLANVPAGLTMVGPFPMDSLVMLTVMNETNELCRVFSDTLTSASVACVDSVCAAEAFEYCYTNNDTAWFMYQGTEDVPITIEFLWGGMGAGDYVQIYDVEVPPAAPDWQGNLVGDMTSFVWSSTNPEHRLLMRVVSNSAVSCASGEVSPILHWVVQCGAVGINENPASDFSMYPNPTTGQLMLHLPQMATGQVDMRVLDLLGRTVHHELFTASGTVNTFDLHKLQSGNYTVTITTENWVKSQQLQILR